MKRANNIFNWNSWRSWFLTNVDLLMIISLLFIIAGTWVFAEIADEVAQGELQNLDDRIVAMMRNPDNPADPIGPVWFEESMRDFSALGGPAVLFLVIIAVGGYFLLRRFYDVFVLLIFASCGGFIFTLLLKGLFHRPRPELVPHLSNVYTSSFPSGHSMLSAVVYLTLGTLLGRLVTRYRHKLYIVGMAVMLTFIVGISRVYLGVHYPSDVLAGWAAGLSWALLCWLVAYYLQKRKTIETNF